MRRVVHLHIGAPKTGTTYVQDRLSLNAGELAKHGVTYPGRTLGDPSTFHFRAALDLLDQDWGGTAGHAAGAWKQMVRKVRRQRGNVVISHEILAPAPPDKVARVMHDLRGSEIHLVYSVRDLGRQLPAAWQESIKQGRGWTFRRFLDSTERGDAWSALAFDLPGVLNTWGKDLPPEHIHVVTVPRHNTRNPDLLWRRMCLALDIEPDWAPVDSTKTNKSLGTVETQLIRKLNRRMGRTTRRDDQHDELILGLLAREHLARPKVGEGHPAAQPLRLGRADGKALDRLDSGQRDRPHRGCRGAHPPTARSGRRLGRSGQRAATTAAAGVARRPRGDDQGSRQSSQPHRPQGTAKAARENRSAVTCCRRETA